MKKFSITASWNTLLMISWLALEVSLYVKNPSSMKTRWFA